MWDLSFLTRDGSHVPCITRQTFNHWTTREAPGLPGWRTHHLVATLAFFRIKQRHREGWGAGEAPTAPLWAHCRCCCWPRPAGTGLQVQGSLLLRLLLSSYKRLGKQSGSPLTWSSATAQTLGSWKPVLSGLQVPFISSLLQSLESFVFTPLLLHSGGPPSPFPGLLGSNRAKSRAGKLSLSRRQR